MPHPRRSTWVLLATLLGPVTLSTVINNEVIGYVLQFIGTAVFGALADRWIRYRRASLRARGHAWPSGRWHVTLQEAGPNSRRVARVVRQSAGWHIRDAREQLALVPAPVVRDVDETSAQTVTSWLTAAGATASCSAG